MVLMWRQVAALSRRGLAVAAAGATLSGSSFSLVYASDGPVGAMQLPPSQQPAAAGGSGPSTKTAKEAATGHLKIGVTMREMSEGTGEVALPGMMAIVHYTVTLVGDGTILDDTRTSGFGDRRCNTRTAADSNNHEHLHVTATPFPQIR